MLKLSQARKDQVKEIQDDFDFYKNCSFGEFYLVNGDELTYINLEDDGEILSRIHHGERIVSIRDDI